MPQPATSKGRIAAKELRVKCMELKKKGVTFRVIANTLGIGVATAHKHVKTAMAELNEQSLALADTYRTLQLERYENLLFNLQNKIGKGEVGAISTATRVLDSINRLVGVEAPQKVAPTTPDGQQPYNPLHDLTPEERRARIKELEEKLKK